MPDMTPPLHINFTASDRGLWQVDAIHAVCGETLDAAARLSVTEGMTSATRAGTVWTLSGTTSNTRYTNRSEVLALSAKQEVLGRSSATCAALIPIRKTPEWWALAQDERRHILEEQSRHIAIGLEYLPAIARRLHHCRELNEPFDFLTWFEFAPDDSASFDDLLARLRQSREWRYVEREVDVRLSR